MKRRVVLAVSLILALGVVSIPAGAQLGSQPRVLTGSYVTTNPIYPTIGAETGVLLYDLSGFIHEDYMFVSPPDTQVLGTLQGDIASGQYAIDLPDMPGGTLLDFDGDDTTPPAVQVYATATYIDFLGDIYVNRGESPLDLSIRVEPMSYAIIGGHVVVWAANQGEWFPNGLGRDGALFTGDESLMMLPAGWSVIDLDSDPFTIIRNETVDIPLIESMGALNDYSSLSYQDAWEKLFARTRETYPFSEEKGLDWDAIYDEVTPYIEAATQDIEFHLAITHFGGLIPDTHIGYVSLPVMQTFLMGGVGISELAVTSANEIVITGVNENSPAATAGIQAGDVLVAVGDKPALEYLDNTPLLLSSASTVHGRRYIQLATMLQGPAGSEVTLTWRDQNGGENTATMKRIFDASSILAAFTPSGMSDPVVSSRMLESGLGYIRVRGFAEEVSQAEELFSQQLLDLIDAGASGIILDLRSNSGGLVNLAMAMTGHFFPDYERILDFYYANGEGGFSYRGYLETLPGDPYYTGPVAVLVDEMTGSAGDIFVYTMQFGGRALIVGHTPSGGFTGEVSDGQYQLPGDLQMQIPTGRPVDPDSGATLIEGEGVIPDILVPVTVESLLSRDDEVLQAAETALLERD